MLYTGVTNNLERRLHEHNEGLGEAGKFTGRYQCNLLVYFEAYPDATQAIAREKQIENWTRNKKEYLINLLNPSREQINLLNISREQIDLQTWAG